MNRNSGCVIESNFLSRTTSKSQNLKTGQRDLIILTPFGASMFAMKGGAACGF